MNNGSIDQRRWLDAAPQIQEVGSLKVLRDDLLPGGTKLRFLPFLVAGASEIVYGGPFCGAAQVALSVIGKESGQKVTLFTAERKELHQRQKQAVANGAEIKMVAPGYLTVVQKRARDYAAATGALFLPLGFDLPAASAPFLEAIRAVRAIVGDPPEVWCATGSGMLARCLAVGFPSSKVIGIAVGLKSRHGAQEMPANAELREAALPFDREERKQAPFPSCPNYDRKAWMEAERSAAPGSLFWNVFG